jgi:CRISPR-associated protein Csy1
MSHPMILKFLASQKQEWLLKEIKAGMSENKKESLNTKASELYNTTSLAQSVKNVANNEKISNLNFATHLAKFSHPSIKMSGIIYQTSPDNDGFLRTGNVHQPGLDIFSNSGASDHTKELIYVYEFLTIYIDDKMLIEHLQSPDALSNPTLQQIFAALNIKGNDFSLIRERLLLMINYAPTNKTSEAIKQVYFPVNDDYHLLSVVYPSAQMSELRKRITRFQFGDSAKQARKDRKDNKYNSEPIADLYNLTKIGFGGANKQNISVLNNKHGGDFFLLPCMPPSLKKRRLQPPKHNFFTDSLYAKNYQEEFKKLHVLFSANDTLIIKNQRRYWIKYILYQVVEKIWQVRMIEGGWSRSETYQRLKLYQKTWLDQAQRDSRKTVDFDLIRKDCVNWLVTAYNETSDNNTKRLGDDHKPDIEKTIDEMQEALQ